MAITTHEIYSFQGGVLEDNWRTVWTNECSPSLQTIGTYIPNKPINEYATIFRPSRLPPGSPARPILCAALTQP